VDANATNFTLPTANLTSTLEALEGTVPGFNASFINNLDVVLVNDANSPLNGLNLRDLVDGDYILTLEQLVLFGDQSNLTRFEIPLPQAINSVINVSSIELALFHTFTVIDSFDYPHGKFGDSLGNVAVIDCHYANQIMLTSY